MQEDYISVKEATVRFGLSGAWLRRLLERGEIKGRKIGNSWAIEPPSIQKYLSLEHKPGPNPKKVKEKIDN